jgi:cytochrome c oxidase subunit III
VSSIVQIAPPRARLKQLPLDQKRGLWGMWCTIATEAMLFACMFSAYYYLGSNKDRWAMHPGPELKFPFPMLAVLLTSSLVLYWGERRAREENFFVARMAVWATFVLGLTFLTVQGFEYYWSWSQSAPYSDSYGSIFYAITTLHASHVMVGLGMLAYIGVMPRYGRTARTPHQPYETVSKYWHFVDVVWIFIVVFLYVIPNFQRMNHVH